MTLYTSDIKRQYAKMLTVSIFVLAFGAVYELFSHGVISLFMILAFLIPLVFAAVPYLAFHKLNKSINRVSVSLYNSAIYVFTAGSIIKGALEIYGTTNSLIAVYPIAGAILTAAAGISLRLHFSYLCNYLSLKNSRKAR